ncbi:MAG: hypothetical protein RJQ04_06475 [Longimicrobiales bacterium]
MDGTVGTWKGVGMRIMMAMAVGLLAAAGPGAGAVAAQSVTLAAGASSYDLAGTGTSWVASARVDGALAPTLRWQAGVGLFRYGSQADRKVTLIMPEAGVEWHPPLPMVPLYLGAGVGYAAQSAGQEDDPTLYAALGLDARVAPMISLRPELRVRAVDPWVGTLADFSLGVRFGR